MELSNTLWDTPTTEFLVKTAWDKPLHEAIQVTLSKDANAFSIRSRYSLELKGLKKRLNEGHTAEGDLVRKAFKRCYSVRVDDTETLTLIPSEATWLEDPDTTFAAYVEKLNGLSNRTEPRKESTLD